VTIPGVPGRVSSPAFVGRPTQLDALVRAIHRLDDDPRRVILVHGEAGIGKTRLIAEYARALAEDRPGRRPAILVRGTCLESVGAAIPYAPILDVLEGLGGANPELSDRAAALRDDLAGAPTSTSAETGRGRAFMATRELLILAAAETDVVVAIDDLHWADRSTLELIAFLARRVTPARVLLVLIYRSDELHRRHPLVPVLAELERGAVLDSIPLPPLEPDAIREQARAILGVNADPGRVERIVGLADGNPFHAEELLALASAEVRIPRLLRDVLLARLGRLDEETIDVLGRAAIVGRDVDERLLVAISDMAPALVTAALRQAVSNHILEADPDGHRYRFRHALLREAVHDDLLPADRLVLHRRTAQALAREPELAATSPAGAAGEIAYHWWESGDRTHAIPALLQAGEAAAAAYAWTEAAGALERAAMMAREGAVTMAPVELAELLMRAASLADHAGDFRRAIALGRAAIETDDGLDPRRSGRMWSQLQSIANDAGEWELSHRAAAMGVALIPADPPSFDRAWALGSQAGEWATKNECRAAIRLADETLEICRLIDAPDVEVATLAIRAMACASLGRAPEALAAHAAAVAGLERPGLTKLDTFGTVLANGGLTLLLAERFEDCIRFTDLAVARAATFAAELSWAPWLHPSAGYAAFLLGRWDEAGARFALVHEDDVLGHPTWQVLIYRGLLDAWRGDIEAVESKVLFAEAAPWEVSYVASWDTVRSVAASWAGRAADAAVHADRALERFGASEDVTAVALGVVAGAWAHADVATEQRARRRPHEAEHHADRADELAALARRLADGTWLDESAATDWVRALAATARAEAERAHGRADPEAWRRAVVAHAAVGTVPDLAYARYRFAEASLAADDRASALDALVAAREFATSVGALPLRNQIEDLARRARIALDQASAARSSRPIAPSPPDPWGLSTREREVLDLLGAGRTNRQIADALFISVKTASVHVTHILDKLGVSSRTEAALLAGRAGMLDRPDDPVGPH
jgi:DNA-binding CsgD family transcriptional regulator